MKTNAPTKLALLIAVILAVVALLGFIVTIPFVSMYAFWILCAGFCVLLAGCLLKGF